MRGGHAILLILRVIWVPGDGWSPPSGLRSTRVKQPWALMLRDEARWLESCATFHEKEKAPSSVTNLDQSGQVLSLPPQTETESGRSEAAQ